MRRAGLTLWRTSMLRQIKLKVLVEVANGISDYNDTFFSELPRLYCALSKNELDRETPRRNRQPLASFLRVGSWIGGDRDGNPFVTAEVLSDTTRLQSATAIPILSR